MTAPQLEVADVFRQFGELYRSKWPVSDHQRAVMRAIELCRTPILGGRLFRCDGCGAELQVHNSCGNRHCSKCQTLEKAQWVDARAQDLLPVPYFHVIFTLPHTIHPLTRAQPRFLYNLLFHTAQKTLLKIAANPEYLGARIGVCSILHTWGSRMNHHPHLHCVVQGGGPAPDGGQWVNAHDSFFVPVQVLTADFKQTFLDDLEKAYRRSQLQLHGPLEDMLHPVYFNDFLDRLRRKKWCVFSKPPFGGPKQVLEYLARYTHRVAISNERLLRMEGEFVLFRYKDYNRGGRWRTERIHGTEFIRRFLLHVLPYRFVRIRYCGLLANRYRKENLRRCRAQLRIPPPDPPPVRESAVERCLRLTGKDLSRCPTCREGRLILRCTIPRPSLSDLVSRPRRRGLPPPPRSPVVSRGPP